MNENELNTLLQEIRMLLGPIRLQESGAVFYSGRRTLDGNNNLYLMGLNPGGDPELCKKETIEKSLDDWKAETKDDWSAYCDQYWGRKKYSLTRTKGISRTRKE